MKRTLVVSSFVALLLFVPHVCAAANLSMRTVESPVLKSMPAMKLVIRSEDTLRMLGLAGRLDIDFENEMGIFISLGGERQNLEAVEIKSVRDTGEKLVVETKKYGFGDMLDMEEKMPPFHLVAVPKSDLPVEGFPDQVEPCEGLCAVSSLLPVKREVTYLDFRDKGMNRGYEVEKEKPGSALLKSHEWLHSVAFFAGKGNHLRSVRLRILSLKVGARAAVEIEICGPGIQTRKPSGGYICPASRERLEEGLGAAFDIADRFIRKAAYQVEWLYENPKTHKPRLILPAIGKSDINVEKFRKWAGCDGTTYRCLRETSIGTLEEVGERGSVRWIPPYYSARKKVEGVGTVVGRYSTFNLFQLKVEDVEATDEETLRKQLKEIAHDLGVRFEDDALESVKFTFRVD